MFCRSLEVENVAPFPLHQRTDLREYPPKNTMVLTLFKPSLSVIFFEIGGVLMPVKFIIVQHNVAVPKIEAVHHLMVRCN